MKFKVGDIVYYNGRTGVPLAYFDSTLVAIIIDIKRPRPTTKRLPTMYTAMVLKNKEHLFIPGEIYYFNREVEYNYDRA